uniref:Putative secreted peptide n=1 Tax=Anopheles braziliensis TaxID=58242 RepID=A0A2M3ZQW3_9DIPT
MKFHQLLALLVLLAAVTVTIARPYAEEEGTTKEPTVTGETENKDTNDTTIETVIVDLLKQLRAWRPSYGAYGYYSYK